MIRLSSIACVEHSEPDLAYRGDGVSYCELVGDLVKILAVLGLVVLERGVDLKTQYTVTTLSREDEARYYRIVTELAKARPDLVDVLVLVGLQELLSSPGLRYSVLWLVLEYYGLRLFPDRRVASRVRKILLRFLKASSKQKVVKRLFSARSILAPECDEVRLLKKTVRNMLRELERLV